ncbi:SRPBCC family protein [Mucilaginibacter sp. PAMB04168]|uniref:SRPBCC family protein n=1 Tax=Mucilaginibacter sp. PAMB04168 TaxID=3138567 RepID=UPI0031F72027
MPVITLQTFIQAPVEGCFDLSRSIDLHLQSMQQHSEKAIAGVTSGLIGPGDTVTWKARHFGLPFTMTVQLTEMKYPVYFVDQMVKGPFKWFRHYHAFRAQNNGTLMTDEFVFKSPLGWLGKITDKLVLHSYLQKMLQQRNDFIKRAAENSPVNLYHHELSTATTA